MDTRTMFVFAVLVLLLMVGSVDARPAPSTGDVSQSQRTLSQYIGDAFHPNCTCGDETIVCGGEGTWVPWFSCGLSCLLFLVPCIRVYNTAGRRAIKDIFFWWSLVLSCFSYTSWLGYSMGCRLGESTFPILMTSIVGFAINGVLSVCGAALVTDNKVKVRRIYFIAIGMVVFLVVILSSTPPSVIGWLGLALGVLSHMFRMRATTYDNFDWILAIASVAGCVNGFIWLKHPNLCIAMQYKIASYIVGVLRGWEAFLWFSPWIGIALWKAEGGEGTRRERTADHMV